MANTWRLDHLLPGDVFATFAAALEIVPSVDKEPFADIFVRINSEGVKLNIVRHRARFHAFTLRGMSAPFSDPRGVVSHLIALEGWSPYTRVPGTPLAYWAAGQSGSSWGIARMGDFRGVEEV